MEKSTENYNISFFKPTTVLAKRNRNLILMLVIVWAIAIFGFHTLLRIVEKPTPEKALVTFNQVWDDVKSESADNQQKTEAVKSMLSVVGKGYINPEHFAVLKKSISWLCYSQLSEEQKKSFIPKIVEFNETRKQLNDLRDENYQKQKIDLINLAENYFNINTTTSEAKLLPLSLLSEDISSFTDEDKTAINNVMNKYLIHNQSFLTDTVFLGFPFHYFYTAVFLLILFVVLCLIYCIRIDKIHKELGIEDSK